MLGYVIDQVTQYRVVTASGDVVTANAKENEDLFWALRGAGGGSGPHFGVVVETSIQMSPAPPVITNVAITAPAAAVHRMSQVFFEQVYEWPNEMALGIMYMCGSGAASVSGWYFGTADDARRILTPFDSVDGVHVFAAESDIWSASFAYFDAWSGTNGSLWATHGGRGNTLSESTVSAVIERLQAVPATVYKNSMCGVFNFRLGGKVNSFAIDSTAQPARGYQADWEVGVMGSDGSQQAEAAKLVEALYTDIIPDLLAADPTKQGRLNV